MAYLDETGLSTVVMRVKDYVDSKVGGVKGDIQHSIEEATKSIETVDKNVDSIYERVLDVEDNYLKKEESPIENPLTIKYKDKNNQDVDVSFDGTEPIEVNIDGIYYATTSTTATKVSHSVNVQWNEYDEEQSVIVGKSADWNGSVYGDIILANIDAKTLNGHSVDYFASSDQLTNSIADCVQGVDRIIESEITFEKLLEN